MKRILSALFALLMCLTLISCAANDQTPAASDKPLVVASVFPLYDFARVICKDVCEVRLLLKSGTSAHAYEPTPQDLVLLSECRIFFYVGGESDEALETMLSSLDRTNSRKLLDAVSPIAEADDPAHADEHIWTSPKCAIQLVEAICEDLCALFPESAQSFRDNRDAYLARLNELDEGFTQFAAKNPTLVFADRFPFAYLARDYGLSCLAASEGCGEENWPSAAKISEIIEFVKEKDLAAVFYTEAAGKPYAETVAAETGCEIAYLHACHNLTRAEADENLDYLTLMQRNLTLLNTFLFPD